MKTYPGITVLFLTGLALLMIGSDLFSREGMSQVRPTQPVQAPKPVTIPQQRRPDLKPQSPVPQTSQSTKMPNLEIRRIEITPAVTEASIRPASQISAPAHVIVPPRVRAELESSDCSVASLDCVSRCDPLPDDFSNHLECLQSECKQVNESCLERLAKILESQSQSDVTFIIHSDFQGKIQVGFYSRARNAAWPGGDKVYAIDDQEPHTYKLSCNVGEKICYGAWPVAGSTHWGVGKDSAYGCSGCCAKCDGRTVSFNLF
jgi:hypothetical protein